MKTRRCSVARTVKIVDFFDELILVGSRESKPTLKQLVEKCLTTENIEFQEIDLLAKDTIQMTIPAETKYLTLPRLVVAGIGASRLLSHEVIEDLKKALTEASTNAIKNAYKNNFGQSIVYRFRTSDRQIVIEVIDNGVGMDSRRLEQARSETVSKGEGLGFFVMQSLVDKVEITSEPGQGTLVRLIKDLEQSVH